MTWIATVAPAYNAKSQAFDTEAEAVAWCEQEMRRAGTKHGICYEVPDEAIEAPWSAERDGMDHGEADELSRPSDRENGEAA